MSTIFKEHVFRKNCTANLLGSGDVFFKRVIELIRGAEHYIHIQFYIIQNDKTGNIIIHELLEATKRKVQVLIVVDSYASSGFIKTIQEYKNTPGFIVKEFSPLSFSRLKFGRRLHHKIILVDAEVAIIGGINLADNYSGYQGKTPWLDFAVELQGSVVNDIERICESIWPRRLIKKHQLFTVTKNFSLHRGKMNIKLLQNDWLRRRIEISKSYKSLIRDANQDLILYVSYFFPGRSILRLLKQAKQRGVNVKLVMGAFSDVVIFKPASMYLYDWLLRNEIEIYEWNQSVLHAKIGVADNNIVNLGSYNLNTLSDYASLELNAEIRDKAFATDTVLKLNKLMQTGCTRINDSEFHKKGNLLLTFYRFLCYQMIRASLRILFLLMQHRKVKF